MLTPGTSVCPAVRLLLLTALCPPTWLGPVARVPCGSCSTRADELAFTDGDEELARALLQHLPVGAERTLLALRFTTATGPAHEPTMAPRGPSRADP